MSQLSIVHWNDSYRVTPQKISPNGDTIDVSQFAALLDNIRSKWTVRSDGARDGLSLFSGDLFSPSMESTVTRGSHLVPVMNELAPDVAVAGNHDFDFGYPHLTELIQDAKFPWLLSNIIDENTNKVPEHLHSFQVLERSKVRIGIIGLVEEAWICTIAAWPSNFKFKDMAKTGKELSEKLRGEHQCDLIIALTHCRVPNDLQLSKDLLALSPIAQKDRSIATEHGADIIIGGHDHVYFISKGVTSWEGHDISKSSLIASSDDGDTLVIKSGTDFRDLTEFTLELEDTPSGSVRKKVIKAIRGKRHRIQPDMPSSENMKKILHDVLSSVSASLDAPLCTSEVELDLRSESLRTGETAAANWFADVVRHAYDDSLQTQFGGGSDGALITGGTLRGDTLYPAGEVTLGNILEILPFDDPVVVLELNGESLWDALEQGLSKYPAHEGRFPIVSGFRVSWDSRRPPGQRVLGVWLVQEVPKSPLDSTGTGIGTCAHVDGEFVKRENGRTYKILTREYMAEGHDGYAPLVGHKYLIDDEHGQIMSSLVRKYLLGAHFVNKMARLHGEEQETDHRHSGTADVVRREIDTRKRHASHEHHHSSRIAQKWHHAAARTLHKLRSRTHYVDHFNISAREHMSDIDHYDGKRVRQGGAKDSQSGTEKTRREDLLVIHPVVDGRLKDEGRN